LKDNYNMKMKYALMLPVVVGGLVLVSGCVVEPNGAVAFQPLVVAPAPVVVDAGPPPAPAVEVDVDVVPDNYVWDGYEYVGVVGGGFYYLGPGNVWIVCDRDRLDRFNGWQRGHPDWRDHMVRNDRFRNDAHGQFHPVGQERIQQQDQKRAAYAADRGERIQQRDQARDAAKKQRQQDKDHDQGGAPH
jgi:hypothetical protein